MTSQRATPLDDIIVPDGDQVRFAITREGSAACCRQLLSNLAEIEAHPGDRGLQSEFLARKEALWGRMLPEDQTMVDEEHARVRAAIRPVKSTRKPVRATAVA